MPITSQWWTFTETVINLDKNQSGVYELGDASGSVVYIGSTNGMKRRLLEHLNEPATTCIKRRTTKYRIEYTANFARREQELYDEHVRIHRAAPACNDVRPAG